MKRGDELFLHFSFESSGSDRVFNYLHDSNSIFRVGRIQSENFFGYMVHHNFVTDPEVIRLQSFSPAWKSPMF